MEPKDCFLKNFSKGKNENCEGGDRKAYPKDAG